MAYCVLVYFAARVKLEAFRGRVLCGVDEIVVPRNDQRLLKHFKNDPDPYFDGVSFLM